MTRRVLQSVDHLHSLSQLRLAHANYFCIFYRCSRVKVIRGIASWKHFPPACVSVYRRVCVWACQVFLLTENQFSITFYVFRQTFWPSPIWLRSPSLGTSAFNIFHKFCFGFVLFLGVKLSKIHRKTTTTKIKFDGKLQFGWARDSVSQSGYDYDDCSNGDRNDDDDDDDSDECDCELELNVEL